MDVISSDPAAGTAGREGPGKTYDAFISYAHAGDEGFSAALQRGLQHLAKPWNRRRAMEVFRDETSLSASSGLEPSIWRALDASRWLVLLASPEAARSDWVSEEITHWVSTKGADHLLVVVTEGTWAWDKSSGDLSAASTAAGRALRGVFTTEPKYVNMTWARHNADLTLRNANFRDQVATLAAAIREVSKEDIEGEDVKQQRRTRRIVRDVIAALTMLVLVASSLAIWANVERLQAIHELKVALSGQLISNSELIGNTNPVLSKLLSIAAWRLNPSSSEARYAILSAAALTGLAVLSGSGGSANSVAFSPDGKILASGNSDGTVGLWDVATRQQAGSILTGRVSPVESVAFSPDGKILASAIGGTLGAGTVRLWDVATHQQIGSPLTGGSGGVSSVAFSPDGKILASGTGDGTVRLWDVATHQQIGSPLPAGSGGVGSVTFSPDGKILAGGSTLGNNEGIVQLWDVATHQQIGRALPGSSGDVRSVAFSPDGKTFASGNDDGTVRLWDVATHQQIGSPLNGSGGVVYSVAFSPDGKTLASATGVTGLSALGVATVRLWDVDSQQQLGSPLTGLAGAVYSVTFSPDGKIFASGNADGTVRLWDVATSRQQIGSPLAGPVGPVRSVAFSPDGKTLASGNADGTERLWDVATRQQIGSPLAGPLPGLLGQPSGDAVRVPGSGGIVTSVAFSPDGKTLASAGGTVQLRDLASGRIIGNLDTGLGDAESVAFSPDGKILATGNYDGTVRLWDVATQQQIGSPLGSSPYGIESVAFSPDGKILAGGNGDGTVRLWDVATRQLIGSPLASSLEGFASVAFSPDGKFLASGNGDGTVALWDVATRQQIGRLTGSAGAVNSVAFSPNSETLASGTNDDTVVLWDVATRQQIGSPLTGPAGPVRAVESVAFSPDGKVLASGNEDGTVRLWDISYLAETVPNLCASAGRSLTRVEWTHNVQGLGYQEVCP